MKKQSDILLSFGDVFSFGGENFVFLVESPAKKIVYAARIFDLDKSRMYREFCEQQQYKPNYRQNSTIYSIVILSTDEYRDCIAWLHETQYDNTHLGHPHARLNDEDLMKIKDEILNGENFYPDLKERLAQIF